ncbi:MAG: hydroxyacylglutathione hydrolase [Rhodobacteraceae bacterium HLUCCA12]|nr:MAG: hydroxyacylglutathione hydrolase [Rhodobacteraceae bacterium HLUCCA12]
MPDTIRIIHCLKDNYAFLIVNPDTGTAILIDAPEAAPILDALKRESLTLSAILLTHHHWDHVDGLEALRKAYPAPVYGNKADAARLPALDHAFAPGDTILDGACHVMDAPGHTIGHVAFHFPALDALFSADSLMTHGCGRLFEGSPQDMAATIARFDALPPETRIFSGHDYAQANLDFAARFAPDPEALKARQEELDRLAASGEPTTGTTLASERLVNPYLRTHLPQVAEAAGLPDASPLAVFTEIRRRKDNA